MVKVTRFRSDTRETYVPYQNAAGEYELADTAYGRKRHTAPAKFRVRDLEEVLALVAKGFPLWMVPAGRKARPCLISCGIKVDRS